jgi:hypothetical protein
VVAAFAQYTAAQVIARLDEASIANARMNDMGDVGTPAAYGAPTLVAG